MTLKFHVYENRDSKTTNSCIMLTDKTVKVKWKSIVIRTKRRINNCYYIRGVSVYTQNAEFLKCVWKKLPVEILHYNNRTSISVQVIGIYYS